VGVVVGVLVGVSVGVDVNVAQTAWQFPSQDTTARPGEQVLALKCEQAAGKHVVSQKALQPEATTAHAVFNSGQKTLQHSAARAVHASRADHRQR
jgi:hypothetical protein